MIEQIIVPPAVAMIDRNWAMEPGRAAYYAAQVEAIDLTFAAEQNASFMAARAAERSKRAKPYEMDGHTAIFRMSGPMTKEHTCMSFFFGGCSTAEVKSDIEAAQADGDVKNGIVIIDSPGGQVAGTADLADAIAAFAALKPMAVYFQDTGCSAAYWAGSQGTKVYANATAQLGNIGVYATIVDSSKRAKDQGVVVHVVGSGEYKGIGTPGTEFTEKQQEHIRNTVDSVSGVFLSAVEKGRKMKPEAARKLGDGKIYVGEAALKAGLIDEIASIGQVMALLSSGDANPLLRAASSGEPSGAEMTDAERAEAEAAEKAKNNPPAKKGIFAQLAEIFQKADQDDPTAASGVRTDAGAGSPTQLDSAAAAQMKALQDQIDTLTNGQIDNAAREFVTTTIRGGKALPAEKDSMTAAFVLAAKDDLAASGKILGDRVKALTAIYDARPASRLTTEAMVDQIEGAGNMAFVLRDDASPQAALDELTSQLTEWAKKNPAPGQQQTAGASN
jgi:signal peptide peptidase SppA